MYEISGPRWEDVGHANNVAAMSATNSKLYVATRDNRLWWRRPADGNDVEWKDLGHANNVIALAALHNRIFAATSDNQLWSCSLDAVDIEWDHLGDANGAVALAVILWQPQPVWDQDDTRAMVGTLFAATADNALWCRSAIPQWHKLDDNPTSMARAGDSDYIYQLRTDGSALRKDLLSTSRSPWQVVRKEPGIRKIVAGSALYWLHQDGRVARPVILPSKPHAINGWQKLDDNPETIDITATQWGLFQLHKSGRIWPYVGPPHTGWQELDNNPATKKIVATKKTVEGEGDPYSDLYQLHDNGRIFKYVGPPFTGWRELDNNPASIDIVADKTGLYQLHNNGRIFKYVGPPFTGWQELESNGATRQIAVTSEHLYRVDNTGIYKHVGPAWQQLDDNPASSSIVAMSIVRMSPNLVEETTHLLYKIDNTGAIWRYEDRVDAGFPLPPRWQSIGGAFTSDPAVCLNAPGGLVVFARGTDNAFWHTWQDQRDGNWHGWESLGGTWTSAPGAALYPDGRLNVFARGTDNAIWGVAGHQAAHPLDADVAGA